LDAADATTKTFSGSNLTVWNDKSGNARHMNTLPPSPTAGASVYPTSGTSINGLATVNFIPQSGIKQSTTLGGVTNLFWVGRIAAPGANHSENFYFLLGHDSSYDWCGRPYGDKFVDPNYTQSGIYNASPVSLFTPDTNAIANATFSSVYMPTSPNVSILSVAGITGSTNYQGLCYDRTNHHGWCGDLAEVIIFSTALSTPNRQTIESYLAQKWGITSSLPVGHPGLTTSVYIQTVALAVPRQKIRTIPRAGAFTNFLPTSITGCALWFDAADATTFTLNGSTVASWRDKSSNGYSVGQATTSNQPTYATNILNGLPGIQLSLSTYLYQVGSSMPAFASASAITVFMVAKNGSTYSSAAWNLVNTMWFTGASDATYRYHFSFALGSTPGVTIYPNQGAVVPLGSNALIGFTLAASGVSVNVNGSLTTFGGSTPTSASNSTWFMFGDARNSSYTTDINIYEFIGFTTTLTTTQRQTVESYLTQKWGLTSSLPVGHPGLTTTVYGTVAAPTVRQKIRVLPPPAPLVSYTQAFAYTGANQTFSVPATTTSITVYMWGAGGGGNTNYGGAGAMVQGVLSVTPGETLTILVGQGGTIDGTTTFGGGGAGAGNMAYGGDPGIGYSGNGFPQNAGSGGGRSAIQRGGTDPTNDIVVAGGGGGGTYFSSDRGGSATFSGTANPGIGGLPGLGGTQSAGGAGGGTGQYGQGLSGSRGIGGNTYNTNIFNGGGGGGGGYYGGGGGGTNGGDGAGGGGGSSLTSTLSLISGQSVLGFNSTNGYTAPNNTSPYYVSGVGNGAPAINSNPRAGGNGLIVLVYMA
jgi:hypothetical protein